MEDNTGFNWNIIFASRNTNKLTEIASILPSYITLRSLSDVGVLEELPETTGTISGNAAQKAMYVWHSVGADALADDSGLEVEALGGRPGVDSAFFAGQPRNDARNMMYLLDQLEGISDRRASFVTVIALVLGGDLRLFEGRVKGRITEAPRGSNGFGYDPVFIPDGYDETFGQLSPSIKQSISHRARAVQSLRDYLSTLDLGR
ncbi:MAG: RdgB/HAM1 family non-canonical purine NTP pyrophosphatase [Bacteroidota bacterium]